VTVTHNWSSCCSVICVAAKSLCWHAETRPFGYHVITRWSTWPTQSWLCIDLTTVQTGTAKRIQMLTHEALPRCCRRCHPKQGGVWCDHWSSCCNVISLCWMARRHPVTYWSPTGFLFGTFEAASIKWKITIAILHCLSDCVLAYYARSSVRSCWRRWNREKMVGDGNAAMHPRTTGTSIQPVCHSPATLCASCWRDVR